jgi:hypothetical protein
MAAFVRKTYAELPNPLPLDHVADRAVQRWEARPANDVHGEG